MEKETLEALAFMDKIKEQFRAELKVAKDQKEYWTIYMDVLEGIQRKLGLED
jgi:hypothetical protein